MQDPRHYFVFDFETGGLWETSSPVIEVAIIVLNQQLKEVERYENYIKPYDDLPVAAQALQANGIDMKEVYAKGIELKQFWADFTALCKKYKEGKYSKPVLVGHNSAAFDKHFFEYIADKFTPREKQTRCKLYAHVESYIEDTMFLSRKKWGHMEVTDHKLGSLCERMGVPLTDAHRAMNDTEATAKCFIKFIEESRSGGSNSTQLIAQPLELYKRTFQF